MKEIGGYLELDTYNHPLYHTQTIALNSGRNALAYLLRAYGIKKIYIPDFICDCVQKICEREGVQFQSYQVGLDFLPGEGFCVCEDEWLYLVNFYGQISNAQIEAYASKYGNLIVDNSHAYFQMPVEGIATLYTCRKFFGVSDGAFLYTQKKLCEQLLQDESFNRMHFLLGRFERNARDFFDEYKENEEKLQEEPIKTMSKITWNLLHGIEYKEVENRRRKNFGVLQELLGDRNQLNLASGTYMYPFLIDGGKKLRQKLQEHKIYIPLLWPHVIEQVATNRPAYYMAENILPLPIDQRYGSDEMCYMVNVILEYI